MVFKFWLQTAYNYQVGDTETVHQVMSLVKSLSGVGLPRNVAWNAPVLFPRGPNQ